jgi:hypothetical protein
MEERDVCLRGYILKIEALYSLEMLAYALKDHAASYPIALKTP